MKWLKYTHRTVVTETDYEGNAVEREVFTEMSVPDNENGRVLAEKEAYDGVITPFDDGEEIDVSATGLENRVTALEENDEAINEALDMLLSGVTGDE